ncbi:MAG: glycosyltransferase [Rhodospirillales bacterium]|nr:glycosyltransferase [Rhodospirillales bacterium]
MRLSVIVPAFNEEAYLASTLDSLRDAAGGLRAETGAEIETIVVDNGSTDRTAAIAREWGADVVHELEQGIARARNSGAQHANGEVLVIVDADVIVPRGFLSGIHDAMSDPACMGGGVDTICRPRRLPVRLYLRGWRLLARLTGMVQGAAQFCRRDAFEQLGGYDEGLWIGEDVDFVWRLRRLGRPSVSM